MSKPNAESLARTHARHAHAIKAPRTPKGPS